MILSVILFCLLSFATINSIFSSYYFLISNNATFFNIVQIQGCWYYWIFFHYLLVKRSSIIHFVQSLNPHLSEGEKKKCSKRSYLALLSLLVPLDRFLWIGFSFDQVVDYHKNSFGLDWNDYTTIILHQIASQMCLAWAVIAVSIYCILYPFCVAKRNLLFSVRSQLMKNNQSILIQTTSNRCDKIMSSSCMVSIMKNFDTIHSLHSNFESTFSFFPFLTFSELFFSYTRMIYSVKTTSGPSLYILLLFDTCFILSTIILISYFKDSLENIITSIKEYVNESLTIDTMSKLLIVTNLDKCSNHQLTGWKMFIIEPSLVLSFTSALVTFTILFLSTWSFFIERKWVRERKRKRVRERNDKKNNCSFICNHLLIRMFF